MPIQVISLPVLKNALGIKPSDASEDAALTNLIGQCDQVVRTWLRVTTWLPATTYTDYLNGNNNEMVRVRQRPVLSITNVWEDPSACAGQNANDFQSGTLLTAGTDYYLPWDMPDNSQASWTGRLIRLGTVWSPRWVYSTGLLTPRMLPSTGTIKVVYVAGWANGVPADVSLAAQNMIAAFRAGAQYGKALSNFSYKGFSVGFDQSATGFFSQACKDLLSTYRRLLP